MTTALEMAQSFLDKISEKDVIVLTINEVEGYKAYKDQILKRLTDGFSMILQSKHSDLIPRVEQKIISYHEIATKKGSQFEEDSHFDFIGLVEWYGFSFDEEKEDKDYWDINGKYLGLRLEEVINYFLIGKYQFADL